MPGFDIVRLVLLSVVVKAAESVRAPAVFSLAETSFEYLRLQACGRGGGTSVMLDASDYPFTENVSATRAAVEIAHACGVAMEGRLSYAPDIE